MKIIYRLPLRVNTLFGRSMSFQANHYAACNEYLPLPTQHMLIGSTRASWQLVKCQPIVYGDYLNEIRFYSH